MNVPTPRFLVVVFTLALLARTTNAAENSWKILSPDGNIGVTLRLSDGDQSTLQYQIEIGSGVDPFSVLAGPLSLTTSEQSFVTGLTFASKGTAQSIDETYDMVHGKRLKVENKANQQVFAFENEQREKIEVILRVSNDGLAFRYRLPVQSSDSLTITDEGTGFHFPGNTKAWMQPYQMPTKYTPAYEEYFTNGVAAGTAAPTPAGWCFPALFRVEDSAAWVLITEADMDGSYCGSRLAQEAPQGLYRLRFPEAGDGNGTGKVEPTSMTPWQTPWRVVIVADSLAGIAESTLVTDVCPPSQAEDTSWIKPGRVAWSWWSDGDSPRDYAAQVKFVDFAAEMGWEYVLVDANWTLMDGGDVRQLTRYAEKKNVGILLWYNSGGPNNIVTEKPRGNMYSQAVRQFEFKLLKDWGIRGVKIDFFQTDKQEMMGRYVDTLKDAAANQIMVNFHGCTMPRGWSRTYPNLMTMEAVRGAENYLFTEDFPEQAPLQNTILPFTRNVVGSMDYTPVTFSNRYHPHLTSSAHELALSVVFESGWLHFADSVESYQSIDQVAKVFLKNVPVTWDDTRLLDGYPGDFVVIARRKGDTWYIGGINAKNEQRTMTIDLSKLGSADKQIQILNDAQDDDGFQSSSFLATDSIEVTMQPRGGFVMHFED